MDYQKLYVCVFNALTDAISKIDLHEYGSEREILVLAQQKAEDMYLDMEDEEDS